MNRSALAVVALAFAAGAVMFQVTVHAQGAAGRTGGRGVATATTTKAPVSPVTGNAVNGKKLYFDYSCYSCHGYNGETGARAFVPNWPANLATEASFLAFLRGRANLSPAQPSTGMPNYASGTLSDAQAKDIYAYIRSFKSNAPPADQIATFKQILANAQKPYKP